MNEQVFEGVFAAVVTPLDQDLRINIPELASHSRDLLQRGCRGIALFGTTGEGPSFSVKERIDALRGLIAQGLQPNKLILGNGSSSVQDTLALSKAASSLGCLALLISPLSYYKKVSDEGILAYYRQIIQKIDLQVILYHIPQYTGLAITLNVIEALRKEFYQQVIGLKESEGNLPFAKQVIEKFPDFKVFVGNESHIIEAVGHGAAGSICGFANLYPEMICSLYERGKKKENANPQEFIAIFQALKQYSFIPACKAIMEAKRGNPWHAVYPPLMPLNDQQRAALLGTLQTIK